MSTLCELYDTMISLKLEKDEIEKDLEDNGESIDITEKKVSIERSIGNINTNNYFISLGEDLQDRLDKIEEDIEEASRTYWNAVENDIRKDTDQDRI